MHSDNMWVVLEVRRIQNWMAVAAQEQPIADTLGMVVVDILVQGHKLVH